MSREYCFGATIMLLFYNIILQYENVFVKYYCITDSGWNRLFYLGRYRYVSSIAILNLCPIVIEHHGYLVDFFDLFKLKIFNTILLQNNLQFILVFYGVLSKRIWNVYRKKKIYVFYDIQFLIFLTNKGDYCNSWIFKNPFKIIIIK